MVNALCFYGDECSTGSAGHEECSQKRIWDHIRGKARAHRLRSPSNRRLTNPLESDRIGRAGASWEIYGDWSDEPSKLETTLVYLLK
jgi:hypothetical protein